MLEIAVNDFFYKFWSGIIHGNDSESSLSPKKEAVTFCINNSCNLTWRRKTSFWICESKEHRILRSSKSLLQMFLDDLIFLFAYFDIPIVGDIDIFVWNSKFQFLWSKISHQHDFASRLTESWYIAFYVKPLIGKFLDLVMNSFAEYIQVKRRLNIVLAFRKYLFFDLDHYHLKWVNIKELH